MGLLRSNNCLDWKTILKLKEDFKRKGIEQFIAVYKTSHSTFCHEFIWGDEIEVMICAIENETLSDNESNTILLNDACLKDFDDFTRQMQDMNNSNNQMITMDDHKESSETLDRKESRNDKRINNELLLEESRNKSKKIKLSPTKENQGKSDIEESIQHENKRETKHHKDNKETEKANSVTRLSQNKTNVESEINNQNNYKFSNTKEQCVNNLEQVSFSSIAADSPFSSAFLEDTNKILDKSLNDLKTELILKEGNNRLLLCAENIVNSFKDPSMLTSVEFAGYMIETTPAKPATCNFINLLKLEGSMLYRIKVLSTEIKKINEDGLTLLMTLFPKLGQYKTFYTKGDSEPAQRAKDLKYEITKSDFFPDNAITQHNRFNSFVSNIINRRGRKVEGYIRIMRSSQESTVNEGNESKYENEYSKAVTNSFNSMTSNNLSNIDENIPQCNQDDSQDVLNDSSTSVNSKTNTSQSNQEKNRKPTTNKRTVESDFNNVLQSNQEKNSKLTVNEESLKSNFNDVSQSKKEKNSLYDLNEQPMKRGKQTDLNPSNDNSEFQKVKHQERDTSDCIKIDSMGQGMGCCCLQLTLQASSISEARYLYDMIGSLCPLLLRLTRATPLAQGKLLSTETRWDMLVFSVDCRTDTERGCRYNISGEMVDNSNAPIKKSRFSSIDMYISESDYNLPYYNDLNPPLHQKSYELLKDNKIDDLMARHISSLFIRDPILVYETIEQESGTVEKQSSNTSSSEDSSTDKQKIISYIKDSRNTENKPGKSNSTSADTNEIQKAKEDLMEVSSIKDKEGESEMQYKEENGAIINTDDFENIQSSNWRSMRFKLPAQNGASAEKGWKVEVRPMEIQPTAFENASWCIFTVLVSKAILHNKANFYIPLSKVDENFRRVNLLYNEEDEYKNERIPSDRVLLFYRENIYDNGPAVVKEGTIKEIFLGNGGSYEGIFNMVTRYIGDNITIELNGRKIKDYLLFVKRRIEGNLLSVSDYIRKEIITHRDYKNDSFATEEMIDDLIGKIRLISESNDPSYLENYPKK